MLSSATFSDLYLQLYLLLFRSLILMNSAEPILPVHITIQPDGKNASSSCPVPDCASAIAKESSSNRFDIAKASHSKTGLAFIHSVAEGLLGSIRPTSPNPQNSLEENTAAISDPRDDSKTGEKDLCQAKSPGSVGLAHPQDRSPQWPSIPHEAVRVPVIMPVKKPVQPKDASIANPEPLTGPNTRIDQDFYQRHLPTRPAPIVPRRIIRTQPEFIPTFSFNTLTNAPLLLPITANPKRISFPDFASSSTVNTLYDDHRSSLPVPVTTHTRQPWIPSFGHWVNSRLSAVLTCTPLGMLSNSDSMEEFLARFSNAEGLHKPWQQILDDLEYDMDPFRAV